MKNSIFLTVLAFSLALTACRKEISVNSVSFTAPPITITQNPWSCAIPVIVTLPWRTSTGGGQTTPFGNASSQGSTSKIAGAAAIAVCAASLNDYNSGWGTTQGMVDLSSCDQKLTCTNLLTGAPSCQASACLN